MQSGSIIYNNFLGSTFSDLKNTKLVDICFDDNESMTEFYDFCVDNSIRAIKIESNELAHIYYLQFFVDSEETLNKLKYLVVEITSK